MALFRVYKGRDLVGEYFFDHGPVSIGRHPSADVFLKDEVVSRHHAVFKKTGDTWSVELTGGRNGLFVNGKYADFMLLVSGDRVEIGRSIIQITVSPAQAGERKTGEGNALYRSMEEVMNLLGKAESDEDMSAWDAPTVPLQTVDLNHPDDADPDESGDTVMLTASQMESVHFNNETEIRAHLSWHNALGRVENLIITGDPVVMGRGKEATIQAKGGLGIGNRFALIRQLGNSIVVDRCSRLVAVRVNDHPIKTATRLEDGDRIRVCDTEVTFHCELFGSG